MQPLCQSFHASEGEVSFSSFQSAHVGTVHADDFSEGFLGESSFLTVGTKVLSHDSLEVTFSHVFKTGRVLLVGLQTYE